MADGKVKIDIEADDSEFQEAVDGLGDKARDAAKGVGDLGDNAEGAGKELGKAGDAAASFIGNLAADIVREAAEQLKNLASTVVETGMAFSGSMSEVQAISGATGSELEKLESTAREYGATTVFSASEAADALKYMALAGWNVDQSMDGLPGILDLAAASGMDLAAASDMVTDYLSAFGLEASQSTRFADMLAYAQSNANTTAEGLGEAFKNCAANLNASGQDIETTTALLSMMANQGLKGSEAGTALTAIVRDLTNSMENGSIAIGETSVKVMDAEGNYRDLTDILFDVEAATNGMGDAEKAAALGSSFTADSIKGLNLILNAGVDEAAKFEEELRNSSGTASEMADIMNDNLAGDLKEAQSAFEELGLKIYDKMEEPLRNAMGFITGTVIPGVDTLINNLPVVGTVLGGVTAAVMAFKVASIAAKAATEGMTLAQYAAAAAQKLLNIVMNANPIGLIILGITALVAAFMALWNNCEWFREFWINLWENIKAAAGAAAEWLSEKWSSLVEWASNTWTSFLGFWESLWDSITTFVSTAIESIVEFFTVTIPGAIEAVKEWFVGLGESFIEFATVTIPDFISSVGEWFSQLPERIAYYIGYAIGTIIGFGLDLWEFATVDIPEFISEVIKWFSELPGKIWDWLTHTIEKVGAWVVSTKDAAVDAASSFLKSVVEFFSQIPGKIWEWLTNAAGKIAEWAVNTKNKAVEAGSNFLSQTVEFFSQLPGRVWEWLVNTVSKLTQFVTDAKNKAVEAASGVYNSIVDGIKGLPDKVKEIGSNIVTGIWNGISSGWQWLVDSVKGLANSLFQGAKDALGIKSPSRKFAYVGEMSAEGISEGWENSIPNVERQLTNDMDGITGRIQASVSAQSVRTGQSMGRQETGFTELSRAVGLQTAGINSLSAQYRNSSTNNRPIVLELNGRELGRAVVDVSNTETSRVGLALAGGAFK